MKKKITVCIVLLAVFFANAEAETKYWPGYGWYGANYIGTTKDLTIDRAYNNLVDNVSHIKNSYNVKPFTGKLSNRQKQMLRWALNLYDYEPGEIYNVSFIDETMPRHAFEFVVQINADESVTWKGLTSDF